MALVRFAKAGGGFGEVLRGQIEWQVGRAKFENYQFEPEWEDDGINGISDYCQWIPQHKLPLSINYIKEQVFKNSPIKNCHAWRQK